jgi:hypothetical protein
MGEVLTLRALSRATLARQMLLAREKISATAAVERLCGMQSQLARTPYVGLFSRVQKFDRAALDRALEKRTLVRATLMRGTIHLFSAKDYLAFRGVLQRALDRGLKSVLGERMDALDVAAAKKTARTFFAAPRSFDEFRKALEQDGGDVRAMAFAARCLVPLVQLTGGARFTLADAWLAKKIPESTDARELVKRYLAAFGPATIADAQSWCGIADLAETFEALRGALVTFRDEKKRELFDLPKAPRPGEDAPAPPRFLPEFDNLLLSHKDRRRVISDAHRKAVYLPALRVAPTFLVDGVVAGVWNCERKKDKATLTLSPLGVLGKKDKDALAKEGAALARFSEPDATTFDIRFA